MDKPGKEHTDVKKLLLISRTMDEFKNLVSKLSIILHYLYNKKGWGGDRRRVLLQLWLFPRRHET